MDNCLFCKIARGELNSTIIYENDNVIAFKDIHPVAPVHVLVIPKIHIQDINDLNEENSKVLEDIFLAIKEVAKITGIFDTGYRVISNCGENGGQVIPHLHFHILGGKNLGPKLVK